jgi:hypothetical protein
MKLRAFWLFALAIALLGARSAVATPKPPQKDYLTQMEADKIRDAETTNDKVTLFLTYADDRLTKFQYELAHPAADRHGLILNALLNAYIGCVDDAADLIQLGVEKQENVRKAIDMMVEKTKAYLPVLEKVSNESKEKGLFEYNLEDAIEGTQDAMHDAEKAKGEVAPPPVRRKH